MLIPPKFQLTTSIVKFLQEIAQLKTTFDLLPQDKIAEKYSRQKSLFKSALFSARIEGNPYSPETITLSSLKNPKEIRKIELANLYHSLEYTLGRTWGQPLAITDVKKIHALILKRLSPEAGYIRQEPSAIFNAAGTAVYVCPPPQEIYQLLKQWLRFVNQGKSVSPLITAVQAHFAFEKIHPFLDGNGRVGRLLIHLICKQKDYDFRGLVPFEEYIDLHHQDYYDLLMSNERNIASFIEFFLIGMKESLEKALLGRQNQLSPSPESHLPPRRLEILQIIRDHKQVSLDFLKRRFMSASARLLRYDLKKLQDSKFITKRGITRGVVYEPINKS